MRYGEERERGRERDREKERERAREREKASEREMNINKNNLKSITRNTIQLSLLT